MSEEEKFEIRNSKSEIMDDFVAPPEPVLEEVVDVVDGVDGKKKTRKPRRARSGASESERVSASAAAEVAGTEGQSGRSRVSEGGNEAACAAGEGFLEYKAPDGATWRCDAPDKLFYDFQMKGTAAEKGVELTRWHEAVASAREAWSVLRRIYRLAPLTGASSRNLSREDLRAWTIEEIAREAGLTVKQVKGIVEETQIFWSRKKMERGLIERAVSSDGIKALGDEEIKKLLSLHGFDESMIDSNEREARYLATRLIEFQHLLEDEQGSHLARSALMQELILRKYDRDILIEIEKDKTASSQKTLDNLVEKRNETQRIYEATLKALGATQDQNPGYRQRMQFGDTLGHLVKAMQTYYEDDDSTIIDGIYTAAEIKLLVTPTSLRPSQYRPDLALLVQSWREHFWEPDWEGAKLPREMHRVLLQTFNKAMADLAEGKTAEMEEADGEEEAVALLKEIDGSGTGALDEFGTAVDGSTPVTEGMPMPEGGGKAAPGGRASSYGGL